MGARADDAATRSERARAIALFRYQLIREAADPAHSTRQRVVGRTHLLPPTATAELGSLLTPPAGAHPWPLTLAPSRFGLPEGRGRWRHGARFRRVRSELRPADVALASSRFERWISLQVGGEGRFQNG